MKVKFSEITEQLDKLFFLPLASSETLDQRAIAIDSYLEANGWSWDDVLDNIGNSESN